MELIRKKFSIFYKQSFIIIVSLYLWIYKIINKLVWIQNSSLSIQ